MSNRQMVQVSLEKPIVKYDKHDGRFTIKKVIASRGTLITDVSVLGEDHNGQPMSYTCLLADAPEYIRKIVNDAFAMAFKKGA